MISQIKSISYLVTALLPSINIAAFATPPNHPGPVATLGLASQELSTTALAGIRGGFDFGHAFSISFGFRQQETINGIIVKSIEVPTIDLTAAAVTGTKQISLPSVSTPQASVQVTDTTGNTQTATPSARGPINIVTQGNNGLTVINTQFGAGGITNITTNTANNTSISVAATANIGISSLAQFLNQQQSFANARAGMYYGGSAFK
ncbi:MAG: hypothetical protein KGQ26_02270 [Rhodospirillales bacterium]|nr:hypothetical protein [Rhodospirillales bacterium]